MCVCATQKFGKLNSTPDAYIIGTFYEHVYFFNMFITQFNVRYYLERSNRKHGREQIND